METFPAFYPLAGARVVIAGDGEAAAGKARLFAGSPAEVVRLEGAAALDPEGYAGARLIFVASFDRDFVEGAARAARVAGAPLNVTDRPELSDFHTPAVIDRGQVVAAVGTAGAAPLVASLLRAEIEAHVPAAAGAIAKLLGERREALRARLPDLGQRRAFLRAVLAGPMQRAAEAGDMAEAAALLDAALLAGPRAVGLVTFIAAPARADLISVRALRALNFADVVVDAGGAADLLASHARREAGHWSPAAASAAALAALARDGRLAAVVGVGLDPAWSEAVRALGVAVEVLAPGRAA
jgi:precorrin-2 dehydrogenase/sirohydrochlorin ferrochelatase